jgi:TPR repeat protein
MTRAFKTLTNALPLLALFLCVTRTDGLAGESPHYSGAYGRTVAATHRNVHALGQLGFRYENGFNVPQSYAAAADLYHRAAEHGDTFAQCRLGLSYDKGHGVPQDFVLSYKWLNLAAARAPRRERDFYLRLRDAVASKMSSAQIAEGQRLALAWAPVLAADRW